MRSRHEADIGVCTYPHGKGEVVDLDFKRGSATCRRTMLGRAHLCAKRNDGVLPKPVRDFCLSFLAAQYAGLGFEDFRDAMEGRAETKAFFAWRKACAGCRR